MIEINRGACTSYILFGLCIHLKGNIMSYWSFYSILQHTPLLHDAAQGSRVARSAYYKRLWTKGKVACFGLVFANQVSCFLSQNLARATPEKFNRKEKVDGCSKKFLGDGKN